jgi:hypothetical protein
MIRMPDAMTRARRSLIIKVTEPRSWISIARMLSWVARAVRSVEAPIRNAITVIGRLVVMSPPPMRMASNITGKGRISDIDTKRLPRGCSLLEDFIKTGVRVSVNSVM